MTNRTSKRTPQPRTRHRSAQTTYGLFALGAILLIGFILFLWLQWNLYPLWLVVSSIVAFFFFRYDKGQAQRTGAQRVPEVVLLALVLVGGVLGGATGMYMRPRHKTQKPIFVLALLAGAAIQAYSLYAFVLT